MLSCIQRFPCSRFPCFSDKTKELKKNEITALALRIIAAVGALVALTAYFSQMPLLCVSMGLISCLAFTCQLFSGKVHEANPEKEKPLESSSSSQKGPNPIQPFLAPDVPLESLQEYLKANCKAVRTSSATIEELQSFHEASKQRFQEIFQGENALGARVEYIRPGNLQLAGMRMDINKSDERSPPSEEEQVSEDLFGIYPTEGLQSDIFRVSKNKGIHIFSTPAQWSGFEKAFQRQPSVGKAAQGGGNSLAEINPALFEVASAYLSNGGFNMFAPVLTEETKKCLIKGYLRCSSDKDARELLNLDWSRLELPCLINMPQQEGSHPVHLILGASPPWGMHLKRRPSSIESETSIFDELCYRMAFANFTAQFSYALEVAKNNPEKFTLLHFFAPDLRMFCNNPEAVGEALFHAAKNLEKRVEEEKVKNIIVGIKIPGKNPDHSSFMKAAHFATFCKYS